MGTKKFPSQVTADTEPTVDTYVLGSGGKIKLSDLIGQGVGVNKVTITGHGQFIEADNGFARITSDWYTVLGAPSAPCVRYIYGDTGFHLVPIDYGGAGLVTINGVADIVVFDMPGLYVLECVSEIAWKVSPAADYDAIDTAIAAAVSPKLDAATFNARNLTAGNGLTGGGQLSADRSFAVGAGTGITVNADDVAITTNGVTDSLLRQSAALSVVGRSANSTGNVADIAASSDGDVLRRSGTTLGFGTVATAGIANGAVTGAKIVQSGTIDVGAADLTTTGTITTATLKAGSGSPEGVTTAGVGAIYRDTTNGKLYQKRTGSGNTGWVLHERCEASTYTPTGTTITNLDSITPQLATYTRVGDIVTVTGACTIDPTASGNITGDLSLPIASDFGAASDLSGLVIAGQLYIGIIVGNATNDRASVTMSNTITTSYAFRYFFQYRVI